MISKSQLTCALSCLSLHNQHGLRAQPEKPTYLCSTSRVFAQLKKTENKPKTKKQPKTKKSCVGSHAVCKHTKKQNQTKSKLM